MRIFLLTISTPYSRRCFNKERKPSRNLATASPYCPLRYRWPTSPGLRIITQLPFARSTLFLRRETSWLFCCFSRTLRVDLLVHKQCSHEILLHFRPQSHSLSNRYCNRDRHYRELHYILIHSFSAHDTFALTPQNQIFCWLTIGQRLSFIHFRHW